MKITDILNTNKITISMEVFPPKTSDGYSSVENAVKEIAALSPAFVSCTYGAAGGASKYTVDISRTIEKCGATAMAHLTCIGTTKEETRAKIREIKDAGIKNILALRGDIPQGMEFPKSEWYEYASELILAIKEEYPDVCIGGACYPEKHPEAKSKDEDIINIKKKVDAGCQFLTTQMFFDNSIYFNYLYRLREAGINVPVLAGIMPVTTRRMMERSIQLSGCVIPPRFKALVDRFGDTPSAMKQAGIIYATDQIIDLIANGMTHIHVYTMNKPEIAKGILDNLKGIIDE